MKGRTARVEATHALTLTPMKEHCEQCGQPLWVGYHGHRTVTRLDGLWKLTIVVRRCIQPDCPRYHVAYRPEEEGRWALPHGEFGLEVIALIGRWRFREHRSVPEMHRMLLARGVSITERSVTHLMQRYEELVTLRITDHERIDAAIAGRDMARDRGLAFEVVVGEEVTTLGGHLLGLYLETPIRPYRSLRTTIAAIHEQGGLAVPAHPLVPYPLCAQGWVLRRLLDDPDERVHPDGGVQQNVATIEIGFVRERLKRGNHANAIGGDEVVAGKLAGLRSELTATALEGIHPADAHRMLAQLEAIKENVRNAIQAPSADASRKEQRYG